MLFLKLTEKTFGIAKGIPEEYAFFENKCIFINLFNTNPGGEGVEGIFTLC